MRYPFQIEPDGKFFLVTFPDVPEAITQGQTVAEAEQAAQDALATAFDFYFEQNRDVPVPSRVEPRQPLLELPASLVARLSRRSSNVT